MNVFVQQTTATPVDMPSQPPIFITIPKMPGKTHERAPSRNSHGVMP